MIESYRNASTIRNFYGIKNLKKYPFIGNSNYLMLYIKEIKSRLLLLFCLILLPLLRFS